MTCYQYGANNPILNIDMNGDSIVISHKKDHVKYNNGVLTDARTGKAYEGKRTKKGKLKGFIGKTARALDKIIESGTVSDNTMIDATTDVIFNLVPEPLENAIDNLGLDKVAATALKSQRDAVVKIAEESIKNGLKAIPNDKSNSNQLIAEKCSETCNE